MPASGAPLGLGAKPLEPTVAPQDKEPPTAAVEVVSLFVAVAAGITNASGNKGM